MKAEARRAFIASGLGWGLDGFTYTMFALALPGILVALDLTVAQGGWITTSSIVASAVGGIIGGVLADRFGRARVLCYIILAFSIFTGLTATAQNPAQLTIWRILEGLAFGAEWPVGAALLAEYASSEKRGRIMGFLQGTYAIGWAGSTAVYWGVFSMFPQEEAWRYLFLVGIIPALAIFYIRRSVKDRVPVKKAPKDKNTFFQLFERSYLRTTIIATLLGFGVQGIYYSVFSFLPLFLKTVRKLSVIGTASYIWIVIVGSFIGYVTAGYFHDKLGRRPTFTVFFLGSAINIVLFVLLPIENSSVSYLVSFLLGFFASGQAAGLGSYFAELFPTAIRATGQGFAYNVGRGIAAFGPAFIGIFSKAFGLGNAIMIVGGFTCTLAIVTVWLLPETKGKDIIEEQEMDLTSRDVVEESKVRIST
jgi:MFS family permease